MKTKTKYCKKHSQIYYAYLIECPICVGEKRGEEIKKQQKAGTYKIILGDRKNG